MDGGEPATIPYFVGVAAGFADQASRAINAVATQTADALQFLRNNNVIHTGAKPSNLMLHREAMRIVIVDFNAAGRVG